MGALSPVCADCRFPSAAVPGSCRAGPLLRSVLLRGTPFPPCRISSFLTRSACSGHVFRRFPVRSACPVPISFSVPGRRPSEECMPSRPRLHLAKPSPQFLPGIKMTASTEVEAVCRIPVPPGKGACRNCACRYPECSGGGMSSAARVFGETSGRSSWAGTGRIRLTALCIVPLRESTASGRRG